MSQPPRPPPAAAAGRAHCLPPPHLPPTHTPKHLTSLGSPPALTSSTLVMLNSHTLKVSAGASGSVAPSPLKRTAHRCERRANSRGARHVDGTQVGGGEPWGGVTSMQWLLLMHGTACVCCTMCMASPTHRLCLVVSWVSISRTPGSAFGQRHSADVSSGSGAAHRPWLALHASTLSTGTWPPACLPPAAACCPLALGAARLLLSLRALYTAEQGWRPRSTSAGSCCCVVP